MLHIKSTHKTIYIIALLGLVLCWAVPSFAQIASDNFLDSFLGQYADNAMQWEIPLLRFARSIFWMLALIDIIWVGKDLVLNKGDLGDWGIALLQKVMVIGFFYALLTNASEWAQALIQSFRLAGEAANNAAGGSNGIQPSDIFDAGANIASTCIKSMRWDKPVDDLAMVFSAFMIMVSFALIAALEVVVLVESYIFTYAGIIFLGFGGSMFTRDIAGRFLMSLIAVGAKLFVIQLVIGLGVNLMHQWSAQVQASPDLIDITLLIRIVGGSIVFLALAKMIPETVQGMINGASYGTGRAMVSSTMTAGHTALAAAAATGAVTAAGLGAGAGALGMEGVASTLGKAAGFMGTTATRSAGDAFGHGFETTSHLSQYMPNMGGNGSEWNKPIPLRGPDQGTDLPVPPITGNSIGT